MGSTRFPGKVLAPLEGRTVLEYVVARCRLSKRLGGIAVATSRLPSDDPVVECCRALGIATCRGSEVDVLERYLGAAAELGAELTMRITADCPLIAPEVIDEVTSRYDRSGADYVYVNGYPLGLGAAELLKVSALRRAWAETRAQDTYYREHVMTYLNDHPERFTLDVGDAAPPFKRPDLRLTVDEPADLDVVRRVCGHFAPRMDFTIAEVIRYLDENSEVARHNRHVKQKAR